MNCKDCKWWGYNGHKARGNDRLFKEIGAIRFCHIKHLEYKLGYGDLSYHRSEKTDKCDIGQFVYRGYDLDNTF